MIWYMLLGAFGAFAVSILTVLIMATIGRLHRDNLALVGDNLRLREILKKTGQPVVVQFTESQLLCLAAGLRTQIINLHESEHGTKN